jgi:hypothetical protein
MINGKREPHSLEKPNGQAARLADTPDCAVNQKRRFTPFGFSGRTALMPNKKSISKVFVDATSFDVVVGR